MRIVTLIENQHAAPAAGRAGPAFRADATPRGAIRPAPSLPLCVTPYGFSEIGR